MPFKRSTYCAIAIFLTHFFISTASQAAGSGTIHILTKGGALKITVEYAITAGEKAKGLMNRKRLPKKKGMLFIYQKPRLITMWMKNTPISLDMFFINKNGVIRYIEEKTQPNSTRQIHSGGRVSAVLELAAGSAEQFGIRVGDRIKLPN